MLHIGIVGCSAEGAALCYRTICTEGEEFLGPYAHPEVSIHTHSFADYVERLDRDDWEGVGRLMLSSAEKLAAAGADFLICPDNTIHQALRYVLPTSPLPWLHIAEVIAERAVERGFGCLGITGTRWLVESDVYPEKLRARGIDFERPAHAARTTLHHVIMDELVRGIVTTESVASLQRIIESLKVDGCDAVVLGCTELPLVLNDANSALPTLDSTRELAREALHRAVEEG